MFSVFVCSPLLNADLWWNELGAAQLEESAVQMEDVVMLGKFFAHVGRTAGVIWVAERLRQVLL